MTISNTSHNYIVLLIINLSAREFMSPLWNCPPKLPLIYFHLSAGQIYTWGMYEISTFDLNTIWHCIWNVCPDIEPRSETSCVVKGWWCNIHVPMLTSSTGALVVPHRPHTHGGKKNTNQNTIWSSQTAWGEITNWLFFLIMRFLIVIFSCDTAVFIYRRLYNSW